MWSAETAHNAGPTSIPLRQIMEESFADGFRNTFAQLGVPLSHIELRHVNGWPYVSFFVHDIPRKPGPPPPRIVLKLITRLHPGFRRRTKIAAAAVATNRALALSEEWFDERPRWIDRILGLQQRDVEAMTQSELADHLRAAADLWTEAVRRHFELVPGSIPIGRWLRLTKEWGVASSDARSLVMWGTPVHIEARTRLGCVAAALGDAKIQSLDSIRAHSAEAAEALDEYVRYHGWWAAEDSVTSGRMIDKPDGIIRAIDVRRARPFDAEEVSTLPTLEDLPVEVPVDQRSEAHRLMSEAHRAHTMLDDNSGILASWVTGLFGYVIDAAGERLASLALVQSADHAHALELTELHALLEDTSDLSPVEVAARYEAWQALGQLTPPLHLNGEPSPPPDPTVFPAPVAELVADIGAFLEDKFNDEHTTSGIGTRIVTGRAVVTRNASEAIERLDDGDILVTTSTTPAYNNILTVAGGLVVSEGGPSCHAAIVARELDLPTIVGMRDATTSIPDGATIELNPFTATVRIASPA